MAGEAIERVVAEKLGQCGANVKDTLENQWMKACARVGKWAQTSLPGPAATRVPMQKSIRAKTPSWALRSGSRANDSGCGASVFFGLLRPTRNKGRRARLVTPVADEGHQPIVAGQIPDGCV